MIDDLKKLIDSIRDFESWNTVKKIKFFLWYKEATSNRDNFSSSEINKCFELARLTKPSNTNSFINGLIKKRPPEVIKKRKGFYQLTGIQYDYFNDKFGKKASTLEVLKILKDLESKIPDQSDKVFFEEALRCYTVEAYRATVIMIWNMSYYHLEVYIFKNKLIEFNDQLPKTYPKAKVSSIKDFDDFSILKESELIQVAKSAGIITNDVYKILNQKLGRRNSAAHPSTIIISRLQTEEFIHDLITNVVLKYT